MPPSSISTTHGGCWLTIVGMPVSQAKNLLGASYELFYHPGMNETVLRTVGYALPTALHIHVRAIAPTTAFTSTRLLQPEETPRSRSGGAVNATSGEPVDMLCATSRTNQTLIVRFCVCCTGRRPILPPQQEIINSGLWATGMSTRI